MIIADLRSHKHGEELGTLASLASGYKLRVGEAASRLYVDLDRTLDFVSVQGADTKGGHGATRPRGYLATGEEDNLRARRAQAEEDTREARINIVPLIPSATDQVAVERLKSTLRYHLAKHNLEPHDLRRIGITLDIVIAVALHTGRHVVSVPSWADRLKQMSNALRAAGAGANHATMSTTAASYVLCGIWAQAQYLLSWHDVHARRTHVSLQYGGYCLDVQPQTLRRYLEDMGEPPIRVGREAFTTIRALAQICHSRWSAGHIAPYIRNQN